MIGRFPALPRKVLLCPRRKALAEHSPSLRSPLHGHCHQSPLPSHQALLFCTTEGKVPGLCSVLPVEGNASWPSERHRRINAKIPSPFQDTATHNDLREGTRVSSVVSPEFVLLLALYLFCYAHVCTCAHERAHVNVCVFSSNLPFPHEPVLSYCAGPFPGLFREIPPCCLPFMS